MPPCIAALDVGTTSVKACLFTPELELIACCVQEYALDARGGWVEARPETYLAAARDAMRAALAAAPGHRPEALGLCTQGETMVPADAQGQALRPFLVWLDGRAGAQAAELEKILGRQRFYETTGLPQPSGTTPLAKAMWLRENGGLRGAERLLLLEDYLLGWLTGRAVTEPAVQTSTGWYDIRHDRYWLEALEAAGISVRLLPACVPCGEKAGPLQREAAALLGLPEGIPVAAGAMDQTAAALAAGCWRDMTRVSLTDPDRTRAMVEEDSLNVEVLLRRMAARLTDMADQLHAGAAGEQDVMGFFAEGDPFRRYKAAVTHAGITAAQAGTATAQQAGTTAAGFPERELAVPEAGWQQTLLFSARRGAAFTGFIPPRQAIVHLRPAL